MLINESSFAGMDNKIARAVKISSPPKIDGILNDDVWEKAQLLNNFVQYVPYNGQEPSFQTYVKVLYDNSAIYIGAFMQDNEPDSIAKFLSQRDSDFSDATDIFAFIVNPFNDGISGNQFVVSTAGVQADYALSATDKDVSWNSVWFSETSINDSGWVVELKIPYSAIRFSEKDVQEWDINFFRSIYRLSEWSCWNHVSSDFNHYWYNTGRLTNIKGIKPALRLSLTPYISGYLENNEESEWGNYYNGGLDLKYGINSSFTLDMTLIPDFGQVQSDNKILNLSPFEVHYNERRQFFTEGMDLFNKGNIFYSRRIGSRPKYSGEIEDKLNRDEEIIANPTETKLINATKISGKTNNGIGIGFFNAMTRESQATVIDTLTGNKRNITSQPFTNYNMLIVDKPLWEKSSVSFANTNVIHKDFIADVFATEFRIGDKDFNYGIRGSGAVSRREEPDSVELGSRYYLTLGKFNGKWQYRYNYSLETDSYNPNDMGFLRQNNEIDQSATIEYNIFDPFGIFLNIENSFRVSYEQLYNPRKFISFRMDYSFYAMFKNNYSFRTHLALSPVNQEDYTESRTTGRVLIVPPMAHICGGINTDARKDLFLDIHTGFTRNKASWIERKQVHLMLFSRYRINDKFSVIYDYFTSKSENDRGFVENGDNGEIYFGLRNLKEITNTFSLKYIFTNQAFLNFRLRHYWSTADYQDYFVLGNDGYLVPTVNYNSNHNQNYNAFNIDLNFTWNFAPGSELSLVWKNSIYDDGEIIINNGFDNFSNTLSLPQVNSISFKLLYYLDYLKFSK